MVDLAIIFVVILLVLSRASYRIIAPRHIDGDTYDNLLQIRDMREKGHRRPKRPTSVVTSGEYAYPHFVLWVLSFLPERVLLLVERYFSAISDLLLAGIILSLVPLEVIEPSSGVLSLMIFLFTPQFMRPDLPNGIGLSQRKPGLLLASASLLFFYFWVTSGETIHLAVAVLLGGVMILTSKFSLQAFTFVCIGLGVVVSPAAIGLLVAAVATALLLSRGDYLRILKGHLQHLYDYATTKQYKRFDHRFPNPVAWLRGLVRARSAGDVFGLVYENRFAMALLNTPFIIAVLGAYGIAIWNNTNIGFGVPLIFHVWTITTIICFVMISMPHLLFIGLAERYLEYGIIPSVVIITHASERLPGGYDYLLIGTLFVGAVTISIYIWSFRAVFFPEERDAAVKDLAATLQTYETGVVVCHPAFKSREIAWRTGFPVVERLGGNSQSTPEASREINTLFPEVYDYVTDDTEWLAETYDPEYVIFDVEKLNEKRGEGDRTNAPGLPVPNAEPLYRNDGFLLYRFSTVRDVR